MFPYKFMLQYNFNLTVSSKIIQKTHDTCSYIIRDVDLTKPLMQSYPQGHWIEDSKKIGLEMQEKALGFS